MMMTGTPTHFVLDGHTPVPEPDLMAWEHWMATTDRHVGLFEGTDPRGFTCVSTVFLGVNLGGSMDTNAVPGTSAGMAGMTGGGGRWFETTAHIGQGEPVAVERYATWEEAERGHKRMVAKFREAAPHEL